MELSAFRIAAEAAGAICIRAEDFLPQPVALVPCAFGGSEIKRWLAAWPKCSRENFHRALKLLWAAARQYES